MSNWFGRYNVGIEAQNEDSSKWTIIKRQQSQQSNTRVEKRIEQCNNKNCVLKVAFKATTNKANNNILMLAACHSDQMQCIQNVFGSVDSALIWFIRCCAFQFVILGLSRNRAHFSHQSLFYFHFSLISLMRTSMQIKNKANNKRTKWESYTMLKEAYALCQKHFAAHTSHKEYH